MKYDTQYLKNNHDLSLSDWGPYTKKYMGISNIADKDNGIRFDLSVYAGLYRRKAEVPNVMWESGYHLWDAAPDLSYFSYRQELEWKDKIYTDISFSKIEDDIYLVCCDCVNHSDSTQSMVLHYMASIAYPGKMGDPFHELELWRALLPDGGIWIDAVDYKNLSYRNPRPTDSLAAEGYLRAETVGDGFTGKSGIGCGFGADKGDSVSYEIKLGAPIEDAQLTIRYRCEARRQASFILNIFDGPIDLVGSGEFDTVSINIGYMDAGLHHLTLSSNGTAPVELDGFALTSGQASISFEPIPNNHEPSRVESPCDNSLLLKYDRVDRYYGVLWQYPDYEIHEVRNSELDSFMRYNTHDYVHSVLVGDDKGHFTNAFLRPITLKSGERRKVYGIVTAGERQEVYGTLLKYISMQCFDKLCDAGKKRVYEFITTPAGEKFLFSQKRMAATLFTNVVYPIYTKRHFIKHNTPGRWWDSLYTWDAGFYGIGLAGLDLERAIEALNTYLTEPGDEHAAFIHHGSMVPVQFYLLLEIMNKSYDKELLSYFYPRLKQYYEFYSGKLGSSTTRSLKSNILKTWDYFYNSGGWDDYPPQVYVHEKGLEDFVAPVITTAQCIRIAKIMSMAADMLDIPDDVLSYHNDITLFSKALFEHSWDGESGYFGYVCHDCEGRPAGILRAEDGSNFNMGLDGIYPLVSGICDIKMQQTLLDKLFDSARMFTDIGITAVDMTASYYRKDGYWNGAVWMSHQWFFWKTMLGIGRYDLAYKIAQRALELWQNEVQESYHCYEHFVVESGKGAGWHQFGGLSAPVVSWYQAYYGLGTLTAGFDVWVAEQSFSQDVTELDAKLNIYDLNNETAFVAVMNPSYSYSAYLNGQQVQVDEYGPGIVNIAVRPSGKENDLEIRKIPVHETGRQY